MFSGGLAHPTFKDVQEKKPQKERTRVKRWFILLFAAILVGLSGIAAHQNELEVLGLVIALLAIAMFIWSSVKFSLEVRPPTTSRWHRRLSLPRIRRRRRVRESFTDELHAAIFQKRPAE